LRFRDKRLNSSAMRYPAVLLIVFALVASAVPQPASAQDDEAAWLLAQINALRQRNGAAPLAINPQLTAAAGGHSSYLATHPYSDPHREANGSTPQSRALAAGYPGRLVGENVVGGTGSNVQWALNWWLNSPIHLHNMLAEWTEVGIGIVSGPYGKWYTTDFGTQGAGLVQPTAPPGGNSSPGSEPTRKSDAPRPTRRPATRAPTFTPTVTYTPSITYTPRPTFTPTATTTGVPPTETAIVLEVSPQSPGEKSSNGQVVAFAPTPISGATPVAVAMVQGFDVVPSTDKASASDTIRGLIPLALLLQVLVVGGLIANSVVRRKRR
jgi:uncharacterized protein YkwD